MKIGGAHVNGGSQKGEAVDVGRYHVSQIRTQMEEGPMKSHL